MGSDRKAQHPLAILSVYRFSLTTGHWRKAELAPGRGVLRLQNLLTRCSAHYPEMSPEMLLVVAVASFTVLLAIVEWSNRE
jgi:hypothetical protein